MQRGLGAAGGFGQEAGGALGRRGGGRGVGSGGIVEEDALAPPARPAVLVAGLQPEVEAELPGGARLPRLATTLAHLGPAGAGVLLERAHRGQQGQLRGRPLPVQQRRELLSELDVALRVGELKLGAWKRRAQGQVVRRAREEPVLCSGTVQQLTEYFIDRASRWLKIEKGKGQEIPRSSK